MRGNNYGPTPDEIAEALQKVRDCGTTAIPRVGVLRTLESAGIKGPVRIGQLTLVSYNITDGRPMHGEMRSDDHVSLYEVRGPECPECGSESVTKKYSAHHHISGYLTKICDMCDAELENDSWG